MGTDRSGKARRARRAVTPAWRIAAFLCLLVVPTLLELVLADRKFGSFTGGFGSSRTIDTPAEWLVFLPLLLIANAMIAAIVTWILLQLHGRRWSGRLFVVNLGVIATGIAVALIVARFEVLRYVSDAMSYRVVRDMAGGSLTDAMLYMLDGQGLALLLGVGAIALVAVAMRWATLRDAAPAAHRARTPRARRLAFVIGLLALPALLLLADRTGDMRYPADRFIGPGSARALLDLATDFDRDGYGAFGLNRDPALFDAARYPFALDVPNNGLDEDGIGGDYTAVVAPRPPATLALPAHPKNLIVVVVESMRGDVLGKRINGKVVAPNLEALARDGSAFATYSHVGFTIDSLKSLFTGELAPSGPRASLFPLLKRAGYRVAVFSGQPESFGDIAGVTGMRAAADPMIDAHVLKDQRAGAFAAEGSLLVDETRLLAAYDERLGKARWDRPLFAYFNFQSPHFPYWHDGMHNLIEPAPLSRGADHRRHRSRTARADLLQRGRLVRRRARRADRTPQGLGRMGRHRIARRRRPRRIAARRRLSRPRPHAQRRPDADHRGDQRARRRGEIRRAVGFAQPARRHPVEPPAAPARTPRAPAYRRSRLPRADRFRRCGGARELHPRTRHLVVRRRP